MQIIELLEVPQSLQSARDRIMEALQESLGLRLEVVIRRPKDGGKTYQI